MGMEQRVQRLMGKERKGIFKEFAREAGHNQKCVVQNSQGVNKIYLKYVS